MRRWAGLSLGSFEISFTSLTFSLSPKTTSLCSLPPGARCPLTGMQSFPHKSPPDSALPLAQPKPPVYLLLLSHPVPFPALAALHQTAHSSSGVGVVITFPGRIGWEDGQMYLTAVAFVT